jgi:hypothetical protein
MLSRVSFYIQKFRNLLEAFNRRTARADIERLYERVRASRPDSLVLYGYSVYSQADEDGILHEILERIELPHGKFLEIGVGDGRENNTAYLLAKGWSGGWVDANRAQAERIRKGLAPILASGQLNFSEMMVTPGNVGEVERTTVRFASVDVFSLDIDGQDLHVATELFKQPAFKPKVVIVEYNPVFPPPVEFVMPAGGGSWTAGDYFGASYAAWVKFFESRGYKPVACSMSGSNIFLVREDLVRMVAVDVPPPQTLYQQGKYDLIAGFRTGHPRSYEALVAVASANFQSAARRGPA